VLQSSDARYKRKDGHSIEVNNSRRLFYRLTVYRTTITIGGSVKEQPRWNSMADERYRSNNILAVAASTNAFTINDFTLCGPVTLTLDLLT